MSVHLIRGPEEPSAPPYDPEAEETVLGCCLLSRDAVGTAAALLAPGDFYRPTHAETFGLVLDLYARGVPVDAVTLADELRRHGRVTEVELRQHLAALVHAAPRAGLVDHYARIVADKATLRRLMDAGQQITDLAAAGQEDPKDALLKAEALVYGASRRAVSSAMVHVGDLLAPNMEIIERIHERRSPVTGTPTGLDDLDDLTAGLQPSNLIVLASRPGVGKSAMALEIARFAGESTGKPALFFSLEMSRDELVQRLMSQESRVDSQRIRRGGLTDFDWPHLSNALGRLADVPLWIDDTPNISVLELRSKCRRFEAMGVSVVVVDYLQLMRGAAAGEDRVRAVDEIARGLKVLSQDLKAPVVALCALNRNVEYRADKRPMLADVRESGGVEYHADLVIGLYRDETYDKESKDKGVAEVILVKHRSGPTGTVKVTFVDACTRFENLARGWTP